MHKKTKFERRYKNLSLSSPPQAKSLLPKAKPGESYQARIAPNHLNVLLNLANLIAKNQTRLEEADMLYRQAISMRSDYTQAYINRGDVLLKLNRTKEAQEVYERALFYDTDNPDIYYNVSALSDHGHPSGRDKEQTPLFCISIPKYFIISYFK